MNTYTLSWDDSGADAWLILRAGPFAFRVAYIEVYTADKTATAFFYSWTVAPDDAWIAAHPDPAHEDGGPSKWTHDDYGAIEIPCRSADEAERVIRALLGVRGVTVPERLAGEPGGGGR